MTENTMHGQREELQRRKYLQAIGALGAAGITGLAGCTGDDEGDEGGGDGGNSGDDGGSDDSDSGDSGTDYNELELIHWWTAGGEKAALDALLEGFKEENPDVSINNNPAPGGAGSAFDAKIKNRILNEDPPSSFQIWPGQAMTPFVEGGALKSIGDDVWTSEMKDAYLDGVKEAAKFDGEYKAVPLNIHRLNNLFYNVNVLEDAGVDPSSITDPASLVDAMETVESNTDAVGMAHQTQYVWSTLQLWETVLIGQSGVDTFNDVVGGNASGNKAAIEDSLQTVLDYTDYINEDSGSITWDQAAKKVINGNAAFIHQGDWAVGEFKGADDFEFESDWNNVAFPGSDGVYSLVMDSFVFPEPNPSENATKAFLQYVGSVDGQERFNPRKGSIPPRSDVPTDEFGAFLTQQIEQFKSSSQQPPTIAHGTATSPSAKSNIEEEFARFLEQWDPAATADSLVDILG